jgi:hypothetical protein
VALKISKLNLYPVFNQVSSRESMKRERLLREYEVEKKNIKLIQVLYINEKKSI